MTIFTGVFFYLIDLIVSSPLVAQQPVQEILNQIPSGSWELFLHIVFFVCLFFVLCF